MRTRTSRLASSLALALFVAACAPASTYPQTARDPGERVVLARAALDRQRTSPFAAEITLDARRTEQWLDLAAARLGRGEADEGVDLLLTTAERQLSVIETHYARRAAERRLELAVPSASPSSSSPASKASEGAP